MGRVVFVEDDATIRKLVQVALRSTSHEVHFAVNGREGLELVERVRPDVIFTDVAMPEMDGLQLADALHGPKWSYRSRRCSTTRPTVDGPSSCCTRTTPRRR